MRQYRLDLQQGQTSPPSVIVGYAAAFINAVSNTKQRPVTVLDVGCGSGQIMKMIKDHLPCISKCVGLDYSSSTIELLKNKNIYDEVVWAQASTLPFQDNEFDCVLSIECIEHLYNDQVIEALNELKRVGENVLISTPALHTVINKDWLHGEIHEAINDPDPIGFTEYCILEGAVHKSIVYPESMIAAGYAKDPRTDAQFYIAQSSAIDTQHVRFVGIDKVPMPDNLDHYDFRQDYLTLLQNSLQLDAVIVK